MHACTHTHFLLVRQVNWINSALLDARTLGYHQRAERVSTTSLSGFPLELGKEDWFLFFTSTWKPFLQSWTSFKPRSVEVGFSFPTWGWGGIYTPLLLLPPSSPKSNCFFLLSPMHWFRIQLANSCDICWRWTHFVKPPESYYAELVCCISSIKWIVNI